MLPAADRLHRVEMTRPRPHTPDASAMCLGGVGGHVQELIGHAGPRISDFLPSSALVCVVPF